MKKTATRIETARAARAAYEAAPTETARTAYRAARAALLSIDFAELDGDEMTEAIAAATENAMKRREAETAQDLATMRRKYREDARQETAARALEMLTPGGWIEGEYITNAAAVRREEEEPETAPRREMPLALFVAHAAGRALDALIYADGGHNVKMTAREARENYRDAARRAAVTRARLEAAGETVPEHVARLAELDDAREALAVFEAEAADRPDDRETRAALKAARADYNAAAAAVAARADVIETRRTVDPVAQSPESALLEAEKLARVVAELAPEHIDRAVELMREVYAGAFKTNGAPNVNEAARRAGIPSATAARIWDAIRAAAATVAAEDMHDGATESAIARDRAAEADAAAVKESAAVAAEADRLKAETPAPSGLVRFTAGRPDRLAATARRATPDRLAELARLFYENGATR